MRTLADRSFAEANHSASGKRKTAVIIGAGPAGLTAAYELLTRTDIHPIVLEKSNYMGGISRTVNFKGNRIDIGGHRFFSKSDRVMNWWLQHMPVEQNGNNPNRISYHGMSREVAAGAASQKHESNGTDRVMLLRKRKSRVYFLGKFFDYPISLTPDTLVKLGFARTVRVGYSYAKSLLFPIRNVHTLEEFFINRFGRELYQTFFKSYTEKVWGVPCNEISAEWGEQRIKGLSIKKALAHFFRNVLSQPSNITQKKTETSLIEQFLFPKFGPGQMWELVAEKIKEMGGEIVTDCEVVELQCRQNRLVSVTAGDAAGSRRTFEGEYFFSTMAVKDLVRALRTEIPGHVREVSEGLQYRDFITVGLLAKELEVKEATNGLIQDNWIYVQEPEVLAGRLQIFNNWSPYLVANADHVWIGVEYFCYESDALWKKSDAEMAAFAAAELDKIGILRKQNVLDSIVIRMLKTYPAYFGSYNRFDEVRKFLDGFENLFLVGRNGMHKYNNQDHSMLTAMIAVDNIAAGSTDKVNLWAVNTEMDYHEANEAEGPSTASA